MPEYNENSKKICILVVSFNVKNKLITKQNYLNRDAITDLIHKDKYGLAITSSRKYLILKNNNKTFGRN